MTARPEASEYERLERDLLDTPEAGPTAIRGSLMRGGGYVLGIGIALVSVSLLIRHIGVADYGRYVTVVSLVTVASTVSDAGLTTIGIREYAVRSIDERNRLMANLVGLRALLALVGVLCAVVFAWVAGYGATLVLGTLLAGVGIVLTVLQGTYAIPLSARLRLGWVTGLDLIRQVLSTLLIVGLIVVGGKLLAFLSVSIPVGVVVLVITLLLIRGTMPLLPRASRREYLALLRLVLPVAVAVAAGALYFRVAIIVMSILASGLETGYYATAYRVVETVVMLPLLLVGSAFPLLARAARDDADRLRYAITRLLEAMTIVGAWVAGSIVLAAPFAIEVLAEGKADPSVAVLRIQSLAIGTYFLGAPLVFGLLSLARYRQVLLNSLLGIALVTALSLALVPVMQAEGAAMAVLVADTAQAIVAFLMLRAAVPGVGFPRRVAIRVLAAALVAAAVVVVPGLGSLPQTIIAGAVFFAVLFALRGVPEEVLQALRQGLSRSPPKPPAVEP